MVEILSVFFNMLYLIILRIWPFVLIGFLVNILIDIFFPKNWVYSHFGKNTIWSLLKSVIVGLLLSACSYGIIPIIASLRKKKATTANLVVMLIASPWMGLTQLIILLGYVGINNAIILLTYSVILSLIMGIIFTILENNNLIEKPKKITKKMLRICDCEKEDVYVEDYNFMKELKSDLIHFGKNLIFSIIVSALFLTITSNVSLDRIFNNNIVSLIFALPLSTFLEVFGEGFSVFAGEIFLKGAGLGAIFIMMMAGVITDMNELKMIDTIFGKKTARYYVLFGTIIMMTIAFIM